MDQINLKFLCNAFLVCIVLLVLAIVYVAIALPYGELTKIKQLNLEIISSLITPLGLFIGALLGILMTKKKDSSDSK